MSPSQTDGTVDCCPDVYLPDADACVSEEKVVVAVILNIPAPKKCTHTHTHANCISGI